MAFSEVGNFLARDPSKVDPALLDILQRAAAATNMNVQAYSGYRPGDPRFHGKGKATDVRIIGPDGKELPNYQTPETFGTYQKFANAARQVQQEKYPQLAQNFRWGGYFSGGKGKYGAMDLMHFDLGGSPALGMAGGSWDKGLNPAQAALFGMAGGGGQAASPSPFADGPKGQEAYAPPGLGGGQGLAVATNGPGGILGGIPQDVANEIAQTLGGPDEPKQSWLQGAFAKLSKMEDAPPVRFSQMGDARASGDSLLKALNAPQLSDQFLKKRLG